MSKSATGRKRYAIFGNHNDVARRTSSVVEFFIKTDSYVAVQRAFGKKNLNQKDMIWFCCVSQLVSE